MNGLGIGVIAEEEEPDDPRRDRCKQLEQVEAEGSTERGFEARTPRRRWVRRPSVPTFHSGSIRKSMP